MLNSERRKKMPTQIVPKMKYEAMLEEAQFTTNRIANKLGAKIDHIEMEYSADRYSTPLVPVAGWVQMLIFLNNGYGASVIWSPYSYGGTQLLWELALTKDGEVIYNDDYPDVMGWLDSDDILEQITKISRYEN